MERAVEGKALVIPRWPAVLKHTKNSRARTARAARFHKHTAFAPLNAAYPPVAQMHSGNRAHLVYNRIFARSRTPKCAKSGLGASAVHVRSVV